MDRDIQADLALIEAATPGPWSAVQDHLGHWRIVWPHSQTSSVMRNGKAFDEADARMIAAAREGWPAAIAEVKRLRGIIDGLADRVAGQSEVLSRRAEVPSPPCPTCGGTGYGLSLIDSTEEIG